MATVPPALAHHRHPALQKQQEEELTPGKKNDPRHINWYVDYARGAGKSFFTSYMLSKYPDRVLWPFLANDAARIRFSPKLAPPPAIFAAAVILGRSREIP